MLAHLKAKRRVPTIISSPPSGEKQKENVGDEKNKSSLATAPVRADDVDEAAALVVNDDESCNNHNKEEKEVTKMTCDALCSLSSSSSPSLPVSGGGSQLDYFPPTEGIPFENTTATKKKSNSSKAGCPKQLQLPMFLSSKFQKKETYHMIERCDTKIATWSESGDNFVVKNVEQFASSVLPLYFKHSNFSSFARQLNFYGFRKLRTDPILTSDVDPRTACYVRFYHEKFQKDKPELLHQIKRATKTDQQSKDDVESLKIEVAKLKETLAFTTRDYDRKLAELSYECNRRITGMNVEYDKLAALVHRVISGSSNGAATVAAAAPATVVHELAAPPAPTAATTTTSRNEVPDLLQSLSQVAAVSLQSNMLPTRQQPPLSQQSYLQTNNGDSKRPSTNDETAGAPAASRARLS